MSAPRQPVGRADLLQHAGLKLLAREYGRLRKHEPGTRAGDDPEELHDMRVASRRLRACVRVFGPAFGRRLAGLRASLPAVTRALGEVRDCDVYLERLQKRLTDAGRPGATAPAQAAAARAPLPGEARTPGHAGQDPLQAPSPLAPQPTDRSRLPGTSPQAQPPYTEADLSPLIEWVRQRRALARARLLRRLDGARYRALCAGIEALLAAGPARRSRLALARASVAAHAPAVLRRQLRRLVQFGRAVALAPAPELLHALRIRAKKLRYTTEFFAPAYGPQLARLIVALKAVQELLGAHQDAIVGRTTLAAFARRGGAARLTPRQRAALRWLAAEEEREAAGLRRQLKSVWRGLDRKELRRAVRAELTAPGAPAAG